ncbi:MAG: PilN domain-containing protein [Bdellovibrionota bacterium]
MIKINLLGKKKAGGQKIPFGLDEQFAKLGITTADLQELRPHFVRLAILAVGLYLANYVPTYIHEEKMKTLDAQLAVLNTRAEALQKELASKKDMRAKMEELNRGEGELQRQLAAISALQKDRGLAFRSVDSIVSILPGKVWINTLSYNHRQVRIGGSCWEYFPINDFVKSVTEAAQFRDVIFRGIQTEPAKVKVPGVAEQLQRIKNFDLEFTVKGSEES